MPEPSLGDWRTVLIAHAALETGLLAAFGVPATPDDAARAAGLDPRATRVVAVALSGAGYLREAGHGALALTDAGARLVEPGGDGRGAAGELFLEARSIRSHLRLAETLLTGRPADDVSAGDRAGRERFMQAMREIAAARADETAAAIGPPRGRGRLLDVGGAPGTYALRMATAGWDVTVTDLPETLEIGAAPLRAAGIATVPGDATRGLPEGPWDAVYMGNLVHLLAPGEAAALIARAGAALAPGGLLAVQEVVAGRSPQAPTFGVMMLLSTPAGEVYTADELEGWMAAAACPVERVVAVAEGWHHLLLGRRAS